MLRLDPVERLLVVGRGIRRTAEHDKLERLETHGRSLPRADGTEPGR